MGPFVFVIVSHHGNNSNLTCFCMSGGILLRCVKAGHHIFRVDPYNTLNSS